GTAHTGRRNFRRANRATGLQTVPVEVRERDDVSSKHIDAPHPGRRKKRTHRGAHPAGTNDRNPGGGKPGSPAIADLWEPPVPCRSRANKLWIRSHAPSLTTHCR